MTRLIYEFNHYTYNNEAIFVQLTHELNVDRIECFFHSDDKSLWIVAT